MESRSTCIKVDLMSPFGRDPEHEWRTLIQLQDGSTTEVSLDAVRDVSYLK